MKIRLNKKKFRKNIRIMIAFALIALLAFGSWTVFKYFRDKQAGKLKLDSDFTYTVYANSAVSDLVESFMSEYYTSLAKLEPCDMTKYFDLSVFEGYESAQLNQLAVEYTLQQRQNSPVDLTYKTLSYQIDFTDFEEQDGIVYVKFTESYQVKFCGLDDVTSFATGLEHTASFVQTDDGYKFLTHTWEGSYLTVETLYEDAIPEEGLSEISVCQNAVENLRTEISAGITDNTYYYALKRQDYAQNKTKYTYSVACDNAYGREAAAEYANEWVSQDAIVRNPEYTAYDDYGGNCNNYISQCLYAGGIPMDYSGDCQWKYFSDEVNEENAATGRTPSWTSVDGFYDYCENNEGGGLVALTDCQLYSAEVGDIIQISCYGEWDHSVIITKVIYDESGNPVDFLVNSNTSDKGSYPLSAYEAKQLRLIKIFGWDN